jgi:quercetin dioxygenase-like cupin family protein
MSDWFVLNVADAPALRHEIGGAFVRFESPEDRFTQIGVNIHVLNPGEPACKYHREDAQENFLVLSGECLLIIDDQERRLRAWDFVHCPPGADHVFVGAGEGPCAILMIGARSEQYGVHYPVNERAAAFGASVSSPTDEPAVAYADWPSEFTPTTLAWPPSTSG